MKKRFTFVGISLVVILTVSVAIKIVFYPSIPKEFKLQAMDFLNKSEKLDASSSTGTNYADFQSQFSDVFGSYTLLNNLKPKNLDIDEDHHLLFAITIWATALDVWHDGIEETNYSDNDFKIIALVHNKYPEIKDFDPTKWTYRNIVPGLLTGASNEYDKGKPGLLDKIN